MQTIFQIYTTLNTYYGDQHWWPGETPFEVMVGAILTQNTAWSNVERAIANLKPCLNPQAMHTMPNDALAQLIRPSGFYHVKAIRLKHFLEWFAFYSYDLNKLKNKDKNILRNELLCIKGIGKETADSILLYALDKPVFVVDAYTRRMFGRIGYDLPKDYDGVREIFEENIPADLYIYNQYHALIVRHCKDFCRSKPQCEGCILSNICTKQI